MFKSTKNMPSEMLDRLTEDVGGFNNATTFDDSTAYYEVVPSNYLETLLWAEAERLGSLSVDEADFKSERDVVKEEFRYRVLAPPYGQLFYAHAAATRSRASLQAAPASAASRISMRRPSTTCARSTRPTTAPTTPALIVAGDFDQKQLDAWVDKYFTPIPKPPGRSRA